MSIRGLVDGCELQALKLKEVEKAAATTNRCAGWAPAVSAVPYVVKTSKTTTSPPGEPQIVRHPGLWITLTPSTSLKTPIDEYSFY